MAGGLGQIQQGNVPNGYRPMSGGMIGGMSRNYIDPFGYNSMAYGMKGAPSTQNPAQNPAQAPALQRYLNSLQNRG